MRTMKTNLALLLASTLGSLVIAGCEEDKPVVINTPDAAAPSGDGPKAEGGTGDGSASDGTTTGDGGAPDAAVGDGGAGSDGASGDGSAGDAVNSANAPKLLLDLDPAVCNTPDGMRLDKLGNVILSCPNFFGVTPSDAGTAFNGNLFKAPPVLLKITPDNKVMTYFANLPMPAHAPNRAGPMGIDFGPDGNLYIADHQYRYDTNYKSRILRVNVDASGNPTTADVVVEGIRLSNALMWRDDNLYLTDTWAYEEATMAGATMGKSAIYKFTRAELTAANSNNTIKIMKPTPTSADPHLFTVLTTEMGRGVNLAGADGITFDADKNLITGNFGDGVISKITLDAAGNKTAQAVWVKDPTLTCADGIFFDKVSGNIYVADSQKNAIKVISAAGAVTTLWENEDTTGAGGLLDQPAEPTIRGGDLIIANFDQPGFLGKNKMHDAPHTISIIKLR
jgi:DNA-binding beta-propeller fold protein YncE